MIGALEGRVAGLRLKLVSCWNPLETYNQFHVVAVHAVGAYKRASCAVSGRTAAFLLV